MTSTLHRTLAATAVDLAYLASCILEVEAELATKITDIQGAAYDGSGVRAGVSDPTAAAALRPNGARHDLEELTEAIKTARRALALAATVASNHRTASPATLKRNLRRMIAEGEPGCAIHARIGVWVPVYRTGTVGGRLDESTACCRPCYEFIGVRDRGPSNKELKLEQRTGKLRPLNAQTGAR